MWNVHFIEKKIITKADKYELKGRNTKLVNFRGNLHLHFLEP